MDEQISEKEKVQRVPFVDIGNGTLWGPDIIGVIDMTDEMRADGRWKFLSSTRSIIHMADGSSVSSFLERSIIEGRWRDCVCAPAEVEPLP